MKSAIEMCIDAAARLATSPYDAELASRIIPAARGELADLRAEVDAAHEHLEMEYKRLTAITLLWQKETGIDDKWPDLVTLMDWLRDRCGGGE